MSVEFSYSSTRALAVREILDIRDLIRSRFEGFQDFESEGIQFGGFKAREFLPVLHVPEDVRLPTLYVSADMPVSAWSPALARDMLSRYEQRWPKMGNLGVYCKHVFDAEEHPTTEHSNEVGAEISKDPRYFFYSVTVGRIARDPLYRQQCFARMIERLHLPTAAKPACGRRTRDRIE